MRIRSSLRFSPAMLAWALTGLSLFACGRSSLDGGYIDEQGSGGDASVGGSGVAGEVGSGGELTTGGSSTGGVFPTGGTVGTGGGFPTGGTVDMGGASTGGEAMGGESSGGTSTGGVSTGGTSSGGTNTGGTSSGGTSTGGTNTGGVSTGGTSSGGTSTGGVSSGGTSSGGTSSGGTSTGGVSTGGTSTGGVSTGGTSSGGTNTGGTSSGGTSTGGGATGGTGGASPVCGNGVVESGEECDLGPSNKNVYALALRVNGVETPIEPIERAKTGAALYARTASSSNTGYEELGASRLIVERDTRTGVVSLVIHSGISKNLTGLSQPKSVVTMTLSGVPTTASITLADDPNEFNAVLPGTFYGNWTFTNQSDGGVLSGLGVPGDWTITIRPTFSSGITSFGLVSADGVIALPLGGNVQLVAHSVPAMCRADCTIPACGDAVFDAGELCDDGNVISGDACDADCASF